MGIIRHSWFFEYNENKAADKEAFGEYEDLLVEILSRKK